MSGSYNGFQACIKEVNHLVMGMLCTAHTFSVVGGDQCCIVQPNGNKCKQPNKCVDAKLHKDYGITVKDI